MTRPQAQLFDLFRAGLKTAADLLKTRSRAPSGC